MDPFYKGLFRLLLLEQVFAVGWTPLCHSYPWLLCTSAFKDPHISINVQHCYISLGDLHTLDVSGTLLQGVNVSHCHTATPVPMWLALLKHAAIHTLEGVGWLIPPMARAALCVTSLCSVPSRAHWMTAGSGQSRMLRLWWCSGSSSSSGSSFWRGSCDSCVNSTSASLVIGTAFNRPEQSSDWLI
jgi:hypothetical protein